MEKRISRLREFYNSRATQEVEFRREQLKKLKQAILAAQNQIEAALWSDLRKSPEEAYLSEISIVLQEIDLHAKNLRRWARPHRVKTPLHLLPSRSFIECEPLGVALIVAPWNYPFQLILNPLVGAISAGCTAILKTSPAAPATAAVVEKIIREVFDPAYVDIVHGGREVNTALLEQKYDIIFFTGSPALGKVVYKAAAENLTPVVLELGGKSPCIVDCDANIAIAARRIAWGKWLNAGQTCIAPDYLFVHRAVKERLLSQIKRECEKMYGADPAQSAHYGRIVSTEALDRLVGLMSGEEVYFGSECDPEQKYIAPTLLDNITPDKKIMQEEIFGALLPVMTFDEIGELYDYVAAHAKPLALYYFGKNGKQVLRNTTSGGACINDTIMHIANHNLPFGGVGNSGTGKYHGKRSFEAFSNQRAIVKSPTWIDLPLKYPPFKYFKFVRRII